MSVSASKIRFASHPSVIYFSNEWTECTDDPGDPTLVKAVEDAATCLGSGAKENGPEAAEEGALTPLSFQAGTQEHLSLVDERLFVGSIEASDDWAKLKRLNITHVVSAIDTDALLTFPHICYLRLSFPDEASVDLRPYLGRVSRFVNRAFAANPTNHVLIHCFMGASRSVTLACAYLMRKHGWSAGQAIETVKRLRKESRPNPGFTKQLQEYEWELHFKRQDRQKQQNRTALIRAFPLALRNSIRPLVHTIALYLSSS